MKILIVSQCYYPEQFLINDIAPELVKRGHEVTVLTGLPNYPGGEILPGYENAYKSHDVEELNGVHVVRCKIIPRKHNVVNLALNYLSFWYYGNKTIKRLDDDFDIVFSYQLSPVTQAKPALLYKKLHNVPALLYCLDIWPESVRSHIHNTKNPLYKLIHRYSNRIYDGFDRILVTSRPFIDYFQEVNRIPKSILKYLPQHGSTEMLEMNLSAENNSIADFMFAGNMGAAQTLHVIVRAAKILGKRKDYKIHFVGDGSHRQEIEQMVDEAGLQDNIIFHGAQKRADMPGFYKMADALLITLRGNNAVGGTMPGKLQTYMTTGKPIFGAAIGATREVIDASGCGKCVDSGDSFGLATIMRDFIEHPDKYSECGRNARDYFNKHFRFELFMDSLEQELFKLRK